MMDDSLTKETKLLIYLFVYLFIYLFIILDSYISWSEHSYLLQSVKRFIKC